MTYLDLGRYRLCSIVQLNVNRKNDNEPLIKTRPMSYGLHIDKVSLDPGEDKLYYTIFTIKYDDHEGEATVESVSSRILDIDSSDWEDVKRLIDVGMKLVETANCDAAKMVEYAKEHIDEDMEQGNEMAEDEDARG